MKKIFALFASFFFLQLGFAQMQGIEGEMPQFLTINPTEELAQLEGRSNLLTLKISNTKSYDFNVVPNGTIGDAVKGQMPNLKTYDLLKDGVFVGTYTWSEYGVWYYFFDHGSLVSIYPDYEAAKNKHVLEYGAEKSHGAICDHEEVMAEYNANPEIFKELDKNVDVNSRSSFGDDNRVYRLGLVTTGEFYELNGNAPGPVNAVITATVNGLTAIYKNELSISFEISRMRLYSNSGNDPFDPSFGGRTEQAADVVGLNFPPNSYDIGHALHRSTSGDGWDSGGVARLRSVCRESGATGPQPKGAGWSGSFNTSGSAWLSLIGHEFGHMFGANHTFNGIGSSCTDAIASTNSYEIGSGTTIMSYNGICEADQNIPSSGAADNYFHVSSLMEMIDHIIGVGDCAAKTASNNAAPEVTIAPCGATYSIPKLTPFYLRGSATDVDGDAMTYCWEQFDEDGSGTPTQGLIGTLASVRVNTPLFRSYPPTPDPGRFFPSQAAVMNGNTSDPFDVLPALGRTVNMKLTVRDNQADGGSTTIEDLALTFSNSGPLNVPNQNNWTTGDNVDVNWFVSGSGDLCDKADVLLSIDGGATYPYVLGDDVDYASGSINLDVSGLFPSTNQAMIKVMCDDYECFYFYDITNVPFTITSSCEAPSNFLCIAEDQMFDAGDPGLNMTNESIVVGEKFTESTKRSSFASSPTVDVATLNTSGVGCTVVSDDYVGEFQTIQVDQSGTYIFDITPGFEGFGFVSIFTESGFSASNPCPSFVSSSATWSGSGSSVSASRSLNADLEACVKYRLVFYNYDLPANTKINSVSGPGNVIEEEPMADPNYSTSYVVVDRETNAIVQITMDPDFTGLPGGLYTVYSVAFKSGGPTPPNVTDLMPYVGQQFNSFFIDGDCFLTSGNSFNLDIEGSCSITSVTEGVKGDCDPMDNTFTQELIISYDVLPTTGDLSVNGEIFAISNSPQSVTISLPSNGSTSMGDVFFTAEPNCNVSYSVMERENCCPFTITLMDTMKYCVAEQLELDAGDGGANGGSYEWFDQAGDIIGGNTQSITVSTPGEYRVIVTSNSGCAKDKTVLVEEIEIPTLEVSDDVTICDGSPTTLEAITNASMVKWSKDGTFIQESDVKVLTVTEGGNYLVEVFFDDLCVVARTIVVTANDSPQPDLGEDVFLCEGEMTILDGTADGAVYKWFKDGVELSETGAMLAVDESGVYRVEVTNLGDCTGSSEADVVVEGIPTLEVSDDVTICDGEATSLNAITQASLIKWYLDDVLVQSGPNTEYIVNTGGEVRVEAGNSEACIITETITITANESPDTRLGFDINGCIGDEARLSGKVEGETYIWTKDGTQLMESDSFIFVNTSGTYMLEVTNIGGCTGTDEIDVEFFAFPVIEAGADINFCEGTQAMVSATSDTPIFIWYKDGVQFTAIDLEFETDEPGQYVLEASNNANCMVFDTIEIEEIARPVFELGEDKLACIGDEVNLLGPDGEYTYEWFRNAMVVSDQKDLIVTDNGVYVLIVTDNNTCSSEDNVTIMFEAGPTLSINETNVGICEGENFEAEVMTNAPEVQWYKDGTPIMGAINTTLTITETGLYTAEAMGAGGCIVTEEVDVQVNALPVVNLMEETIDCEGETITLESGVMAETYSWQFNGSEISNASTVDVTEPGSYTLIVGNEFDCTAMDVTEVSFVPLPTAEVDDNASFCEGMDITITAESTGGTFQWYLDGMTILGATSQTLVVDAAGTYTFEATGQGNCSNDKDIIISEVAAPVVDLGMPVVLCPGEMITLNAGSSAGNTFEWSTGDMTNTIDINNDNVATKLVEVYSVNVTNTSDCSTIDEVEVTLLPVIVANINASNGVCEGDTLTITATGGETYDWTGPAGTFNILSENTIEVFPGESADYSVEVSDQCPNNMDVATATIEVFAPANVTAGNDTCVLLGRSINLNASGGANYMWEDDGSFVGQAFGATPEVMPEIETTYTVIITDANGCEQRDEVTICIIEDPLSIFKAVTAISPNGDGMNDQLEFQGLEAFEDNQLIIYNRWGNVVYEKSGYQQDEFLFNGTRNGEELPADTYYYVLTFDEFKVKETLTIVRNR